MDFASPIRLVLVLAPIALLVAYIVVQRTRQKYALRFTSVDLLASVAPRRPGWQRHIAAVLMLVALLFLVVGFADPQRDVKIPREQATIMVVLDSSRSMTATDVSPTRLDAAQNAARRFIDGLPPGLQVGLVTFDSEARIVVGPTIDHATTAAGIDTIVTGGGTATGDAITLALSAISGAPKSPDGKTVPAAIVLLSDGAPTIGRDGLTAQETVAEATVQAKDAGVRIDTIAFGTPGGVVDVQGEPLRVPADPEAMDAIAEGSGGKGYSAETVDELDSVYEEIRQIVGFDTEQRSAAAWFLGFALVASVLAAIAALVWSQRLI